MRHTRRRVAFWTRRTAWIGLGGLVFLCGYLTALWAPLPATGRAMPAQAAESPKRHKHKAKHDHTAREVDLAPFMIRNAYHFATLYHAARAARWELAAYQAEELEENVTQAAAAAGPYGQFLKDYRRDYVEPLQQAVAAQHAEQFHTAFQAAVGGCNDCHRATQHGFITIPPEPPQLSIFVFTPSGR